MSTNQKSGLKNRQSNQRMEYRSSSPISSRFFLVIVRSAPVHMEQIVKGRVLIGP
jgi:hypothetical protein